VGAIEGEIRGVKEKQYPERALKRLGCTSYRIEGFLTLPRETIEKLGPVPTLSATIDINREGNYSGRGTPACRIAAVESWEANLHRRWKCLRFAGFSGS
jgi:hypothetical protein